MICCKTRAFPMKIEDDNSRVGFLLSQSLTKRPGQSDLTITLASFTNAAAFSFPYSTSRPPDSTPHSQPVTATPSFLFFLRFPYSTQPSQTL